MSGVRLLAASLAAGGAIVLGGCVAVPSDPYYSGGVVYSQPTYAYSYPYYYPYYWGPSIYLSGVYGYYGHGYYGRGYYGRGYYGHPYYGGYWRGNSYWGHPGYYGPYRGGAGSVRRGHG